MTTLVKLNRLAKEVPPMMKKRLINYQMKVEKDTPFDQDLSDFIQFCRSTLVRPGKEVLRIKHKDIHFVLLFLMVKMVFLMVKMGCLYLLDKQKLETSKSSRPPKFHKHIYLNRILKDPMQNQMIICFFLFRMRQLGKDTTESF